MQKTINLFCDYYLKYNVYPDYEKALECLKEDATFSGVDYACESRSSWSTSMHLTHTAALAMRYHATKDDKMATYADKALSHWASYDYRNSNWWHNDIGVPQKLMHIALFLGEKLSAENKAYVLSRLPDSVEEKWTGANKNWLAENVICKGLIANDAEKIRNGSDIIRSTILISERGDEGVQKDYSFAQHGMLLYNHGYGRDFLLNSVKWAYILSGSDFAFAESEIEILTDLCLKGTFKMMRYNAMDFQPRSREIVRGCIGLHGDMDKCYLPILESLLVMQKDAEKKEKLSQVLGHVLEGKRMPAMEGNSMYYCLDFMTHVKEKYYASVRHADKIVLGGDAQHGAPVNSENLLAGFMAYGGVCYMVSGKEYYDVAPIWDWGMLPGVTSPHFELPLEIGMLHDSTFVGGVSDGDAGVIAADIHKTFTIDGIASFKAKKASFLFNDCIVHLGCDVDGDTAHDINTTYNQCLLNGEVLVDGLSVKEKYFTDKQVVSVYHDNIAYYTLDGGTVSLDTRNKTGDWYRVYGADTTPKTIVEKPIFLLYRAHDNIADSYAYAVVPGIDEEAYKSYCPESNIVVYANEKEVQCVKSIKDEKIGVVFYSAGEVQCGAYTISADAPCILLYDIQKRAVVLCQPEQTHETIQICIDSVAVAVQLPSEQGTSVTVKL